MNKILPFIAIAAFLSALSILLPIVPIGTAEATMKFITMVLTLFLAVGLFLRKGNTTAATPKPVEEASKPTPTIDTKGSAEAEVITLLARMQDKGRLIDFLMDDISGYDDESVGSAARVVYQGCKDVLDEHFTVKAIETGDEGGSVTVPENYDANLYRLTGNLSGEAPFKGTLVHKGWKVTSAKLPKVITSSDSDDLPALAPAQVEV